MKTILIATDFSNASRNAVEYGAELAYYAKAKLVLFHVYHVPVVTTETPVVWPTLEDIEKDSVATLTTIKNDLLIEHGPELKIECVCKCGFALEELESYIGANRPDLIVMGMKGSGYLSEKLIGSTTTALIRNAECPVLVIAEKVKYSAVKRIVLATDFQELEHKTTLNPLKEIAKLFNAHIFVLNVVTDNRKSVDISGTVNDLISLEMALKDTDHTFHHLDNDNTVNGINDFIIKRNMDMVVMIPKKHSLLKSIFQEPFTKRMAFHTDVPLLAIPDYSTTTNK